jgi:hypothetical protein
VAPISLTPSAPEKTSKIPDLERKPIGLATGTEELLKELEDRRKKRDESVNKRGS